MMRSMLNLNPWLLVGGTVLLTVYGQLVLKWQVSLPVVPPFAAVAKWPAVLLLLLRPWVISAFVAAFGASLCWMLALSHLELSRAYPFTALNFVLVCAAAYPLFGEVITLPRLIGLVLVIAGLLISSQG